MNGIRAGGQGEYRLEGGGMRDFVAAEIARWNGVIDRAGIQRL